MMKTRREKNTTPDTRNSPRHKRFYPTFLSSVLLAAALLALLDATSSAAHAAPPAQEGPGCDTLLDEGVDLYYQAEYFDAIQKWEDALTCYQKIDDRQGEGNSLRNLGTAYLSIGQYATAIEYHEQSLAIARDIGDRQGEGNILGNLGNAYWSMGQYTTAIEYHEQSLAIAQDIGDRQGEGNSLGSLGIAYESLGQYEQAIAHHQQSLAIARDIGDRQGEGIDLSNLGIAYFSLGQYEQAIEYYEQALGIARDIGDRQGEGDSLGNLGVVYSSMGQYATAIKYHEQALGIAREIGDREGEGAWLGNLGNAYWSIGQYATAIECYEQALAIAREISDRQREGAWLGNLGVVYSSMGQYATAIEYYEQALAIARDIGDRRGEGIRLGKLGSAYGLMGQYATAIEYFEQAMAIARDIGDRRSEGAWLGNLGVVYSSMGQYATAIKYYEQALGIAREIGDREGEGNHLGSLGNAYWSMGQYATAIKYYEQALGIAREIGDREGEGNHLGSLGNAYWSMGQYATAIKYYEQALGIAREIGDRQGEGNRLGNLGIAYWSLGQYATAIEYHEQSLAIARDIGDRQGEGNRLGNLGVVYSSMGQYATAIKYYEQALGIAREISDRQREGAWLGNLGSAYGLMGQYATAIEYYERAIAVIETLRAELSVGEFKSSFAAENMSPYQGMILALVEISRFEEAFHYAQRAKARTFLDQVGNAWIDPRATDNPELVEQEQTLRAEIRALEAVLSGRSSFASLDDVRGGGPPPLSDEQRTEVQERLDEAYREYDHLLARIKLTNPEYASLRAVQVSTLITVQQTLPPDVTLVEYYVVSDTQTLAFVVTQDSFHTEAISVTRDSLSLAISQFFTETLTTLSGVPASLQTLYDALIAPIEPYLTSERILIAPHDMLHYVPFAALHDGEHYLIERHTLTQLPSASVLPFILEKTRREGSGGPPLILGDPDGSLRFSRQEAQVVAELYDTTAHVGQAALEQLVWEQGPDAGILHLATHGVYNEQSPLFSRILLAAGTEEQYDGVLEVHEVYNLDLSNADLVVLSACETNLGERSAGDEIVGLNRAFIYAGTPTVVASLWSVDDETTARLMESFYTHLQAGMGKAEALRQAQLDIQAEHPHPYYWAGFVLSGDGEGVVIVPTADDGSSLATPVSRWVWLGGGAALCCPIVCFGSVGLLLMTLWVVRKGKRHG